MSWKMLTVLALMTVQPATAQQVVPQMSLDQTAPLNSCRRLTARDPFKAGTDKSVRMGCLADGGIVSTMASDSISVAEFGASTAAAGSANRTAFNAAIAALPANGGTIVLPGAGNYAVTLPLTGAKRVEWSAPQGATVNGSASPEALGIWKSGPEIIEFTRGSGDADAFTLGPGSFRQLLQSGATGHFEAAHIEADARAYGTTGKFVVGVQGIGKTESSGNIFGVAGYAQARPGSGAMAEITGAEFNTDVQVPVVTRKSGLQIVDTSTSVGYGSVLDAGLFFGRQAGGVGYRNAIQLGDGVDTHFPIKNGTDNALLSASGGTGVTIGYGFDAGGIQYAQGAIALRAQVPGHRLGWSIGAPDNRAGGEIRSDASATAGKIIFTNGGMALQDGAGATQASVSTTAGFLVSRILTTGSSVSTDEAALLVGGGRTGTGNAIVDLYAVAGSHGSRIARLGGANGDLAVNNVGTGAIRFSRNGSDQITLASAGITVASSILPSVTNAANLGSGSARFANMFGNENPNITVVTSGSSYSIAGADKVVVIRKSTGSATSVALPGATAGRTIIIKDGKGDAASNNITISGGTIDGANSYVISVNRGSARLTFDGAEWVLM